MKKCPYCGLENPDESLQCSTCQTSLTPQSMPGTPAVPRPLPVDWSQKEKNFWDKMNFRQFAIFFVRLQALWFIFYMIRDLINLPVYFARMGAYHYSSSGFADARNTFFAAILQLLLHAAIVLFILQRSETIVGWVAKDMISKRPADEK